MTRPALTLIAALLLAGCGDPATPVGELPTGLLHVDTGEGTVEIRVSIAETAEARQQGLMGVQEMAPDAGLVFLHEAPTHITPWMKDTLIPLSAAFWDQEGTILSIIDMDPCRSEICVTYDSGVESIGWVEVNQGFFAEQGIEVGDRVTLER